VSEIKLLSLKDVVRGTGDSNFQYYQMLLEDEQGDKYITSFGCRKIYQESVEKTFRRLLFIPAPKEEDLVEVNDAVPIDVLKPEGEINVADAESNN